MGPLAIATFCVARTSTRVGRIGCATGERAAVTGGADVRDYSEAMLRDPRILAWMKKVEVRSAPGLPVRARLTAYRSDGGTASVEPRLRSLEPGEVQDKFRDVARPLLGARATDAVADAVAAKDFEKAIKHLPPPPKPKNKGGKK